MILESMISMSYDHLCFTMISRWGIIMCEHNRSHGGGTVGVWNQADVTEAPDLDLLLGMYQVVRCVIG